MFMFLFLFFSMLLLCSFFRLKDGRTTVNGEKKRGLPNTILIELN